jgi:hypothetical protein
MSALPRQVRKQVEEANKLHEQLARNGLDQAAAAAAQPPPTPPAGEAPPAAAPEGAAPAAPPAEGWEQKYRVLQGKYNAEVPRLQKQAQTQAQQIETLTAQLTATQGMVASIAQNRGPAPAGQGSAPAAPAKLVKDEEVSEFGEELTDFIRRVAQDTVLPKVEERFQPFKQEVAKAREHAAGAAQRQAQADRERLFGVLDSQVPGWREQNDDAEFVAWLNQPDAYSGMPRANLLTQAYERNDAPRVVAFFLGYRNEHAVVTPSTAAAAPAAPQRKLEDFVAPGTQKAGSTGAQDGAGKRIWTEPEIKSFYRDCQQGKYRGKDEARRAIELDIVAATREGRIR